jgi:hypothetical protein
LLNEATSLLMSGVIYQDGTLFTALFLRGCCIDRDPTI